MCKIIKIILIASLTAAWDNFNLIPVIVHDHGDCQDSNVLFSPISKLLHLKNIVKTKIPTDRVFVTLNGQNIGRFFEFPSSSQANCLRTFAKEAAQALGIDIDDHKDSFKLYSDMGIPIRNGNNIKDKSSSRIIVILFDTQTWIWPGVEIGYSWSLNDGKSVLTTVSLAPKIILITGFATVEECNEAIEAGKNTSAIISPEYHHDADAFQYYRTSHTMSVPSSRISNVLQKRAQQISRLPFQNYVEGLQIVRYFPGQYYKEHTDYFNHKSNLDMHLNGRVRLINWIRWIQTAIAGLEEIKNNNQKEELELNEDVKGLVESEQSICSENIHPGMELYPSVEDKFQLALVHLLINVSRVTPNIIEDDWREWLQHNAENKNRDLLLTFVSSNPDLVPFVIQTWEQYVGGNAPELKFKEKYFVPNRFVTIFAYFSDISYGGYTSFPMVPSLYPRKFDIQTQLSTWDGTDAIKKTPGYENLRKDHPECEKGLGIPSHKTAAAMFYSQLPDGSTDHLSKHAGCPPKTGVKWGGNLFAWNIPWTEGDKIWMN